MPLPGEMCIYIQHVRVSTLQSRIWFSPAKACDSILNQPFSPMKADQQVGFALSCLKICKTLLKSGPESSSNIEKPLNPAGINGTQRQLEVPLWPQTCRKSQLTSALSGACYVQKFLYPTRQ